LSLVLTLIAAGALFNDLGAARYTLGWYAGRVSLVVASFVVLGVLLAKFMRLQRALVFAVMRLDRQAAALRDEAARRKLAERKLVETERMRAIGQLASGVAHDFNNLLAGVMSHLEVIVRVSSEPRVWKSAEHAKHAVERGGRLVRSLLAFAKAQPLERRAVGIGASFRTFLPLVARTIGPQYSIQLDVPDDLWDCETDPDQLDMALLNLLTNARDAMPGGGVVTVTADNIVVSGNGEGAVPELAAGEYVRVDVRDTGTGIPGDLVDRVFEPFFTTKELNEGSGLGLSQVQGFVRQSGGAVTIASNPGSGTVVSLYLPRADVQTAPAS
jgi:signal transduction histidine kinase